MNLYFLDRKDKQHLVATDVKEENAVELAIDDLGRRYPEVKSYYQRCWWDDFHRMWIDYGSHIEFYILQEEKYALNVVAEMQEEKYALNVVGEKSACNRHNRDYCDI